VKRLLLAALMLLCTGVALAQSGGPGAAAGDWTFYMEGDPTPQRVDLIAEGDSVRGRVYGYPFAGTLEGDALAFRVGGFSWTATLDGDRLDGWIEVDGDSSRWSGSRYRPPAAPRSFDLEPTAYSRLISPTADPALRIFAGDTVRTTTVDAGGRGAASTAMNDGRVTPGGNPLTGPFYIEGTLPGDVLAVTLHRVRPNRTWGFSGTVVLPNALEPGYVRGREVSDQLAIWDLDTEAGVVRLREAPEGLRRYEVRLTPFLGSIAVAPGGGASPSSRDSGPYGGNMEYRLVREGATVYLPVGEEGAYLYLGDGHAAQGDGELTGDALETSMDIAFSVEVERYRFRSVPRVETEREIASVGIAGSLDQAVQKATTDLARWLEADYQLTATEAALVLGTAVEYDIPDLVLPWVSVAARIDKEYLSGLSR
jgi:acetamidase/formamidase